MIDLGNSPTPPDAAPSDLEAAQIRLVLAASKKLNSSFSQVVEAGSNAAANGQALFNAVAGATGTAASPFTVYLTPGVYDVSTFGTINIAPYVGLLGVTDNPLDVVIQTHGYTLDDVAHDAPSVVQLNDQSRLRGVTVQLIGAAAEGTLESVDSHAQAIVSNANGYCELINVRILAPEFRSFIASVEGAKYFYGLCEKVECLDNDTASVPQPFGYFIQNFGTFRSCKAGSHSFCHSGVNAGLLENCVAGEYSFFPDGFSPADNTGLVQNCTGGDYSFGINSSVIRNCMAGVSSFQLNSGLIDSCKAGDESFTSNAFGGVMRNCQASNNSFSDNYGLMESCQAAYRSFSNNYTSGVIRNCQASDFSFGSSDSATSLFGTNSGLIEGCTGGSTCFVSGDNLSENAGVIRDCSGLEYCFCSGATNSGKIINCRSTEFMASGTNYGVVENCSSSSTFLYGGDNADSGVLRRCSCDSSSVFCAGGGFLQGSVESMKVLITDATPSIGLISALFTDCSVSLQFSDITVENPTLPSTNLNVTTYVTNMTFRNCKFNGNSFAWGALTNLESALQDVGNTFGLMLNATNCIEVGTGSADPSVWNYYTPHATALQNAAETFP